MPLIVGKDARTGQRLGASADDAAPAEPAHRAPEPPHRHPQRLFQPSTAFGQIAARIPEMPDGRAQTQRGFHGPAPPEPSSRTRAGCCGRPRSRCNHSGASTLANSAAATRRGSGSTLRDGGGTRRAPRRRAPVRQRIPALFPACETVEFRDLLPWRPSRLFSSKDSMPSRTASPEVGVAADGFGRVEREASDEHGDATEQPLLGRVEEIVAPADRGGERPLPRRHVPRSADEQGQRVFQAFQEHRWRQHPQAGRGELEGQGQPIEANADLGNGGGVLGGQRQLRAHARAALDEQPHGLVGRRAARVAAGRGRPEAPAGGRRPRVPRRGAAGHDW